MPSAPSGTGAPVKMRTASPAPTRPKKGCPAANSPITVSSRGACATSASAHGIAVHGRGVERRLCEASCRGSARMRSCAASMAIKEIHKHQQQLEEWAGICAETFRAPERLVFAELARVTGRETEAFRAYEEALQAAREHDFIQYVALASELAARFWSAQRMPTIADTYARGPARRTCAGAPRPRWSSWTRSGRTWPSRWPPRRPSPTRTPRSSTRSPW